MKLVRHVGALSKVKQHGYLTARGWREEKPGLWSCARLEVTPIRLSRAMHHQLTDDLCEALAAFGWKVKGYSLKGYAQLEDPLKGETCTLPEALRRQARRHKVKVSPFTRALFEAATRPRG
jgi:hypothetical protein